MANRNLNGAIAGGSLARCSADEEVAACDALPPQLRALIKGSFVNTRATSVLAEWIELEPKGVPLEAYADWYASKLAANLARSCAASYGPDHPQASLARARAQSTMSASDAESRSRAARRAAEISLDDV